MKKMQVNQATLLETNSNTTLLEAMESEGLQPEFQCRDGHCGACKCELVSGEVEYVGFALAFTHPKEILPCICKAKTDLVLDKVRYQAIKQRA
ncbi:MULTISPECIES: class I ribonucleotide reductase maintenance protein YfaE [Vibrio]|uniref:2Fe-2S iron-sulfur cluster binding domain-containing protein n=1 Tax=Vibrio algicola TaxID=2662262 RepID=A0A5Q0TDS9_9VIBR|nr:MULTISPECIES: class I ribonucleotide reductase maintenance protein YfaE [Vibrio]MBD1577590.1 2Fe-2S iron-sulfur cluster binding domain-containing protein [Vibrio sp. S11_S32]